MKGNFVRCLCLVVDGVEKMTYIVDNGGPTKGGITIPFLTDYWARIRRPGRPTAEDIKRLTRPDVEAPYRMLCWDACNCDGLPVGVDLVVFDAAVNSGARTSVQWLQTLVGVKADGKIGPITLARIGQLDRTQLVADLMQDRWRRMRRMKAWPAANAGWGSRLLLMQLEAHKMIYTG